MNIFKKLYCRIYQNIFHLAIPFMPYRQPEVETSVNTIPNILRIHGCSNPLLVTDKSIHGLGLTKELEKSLTDNKIKFILFDETIPNPTISNIEKGVKQFIQNKCDSIIAFGGGSVMDCAKIIGARIVKPNKPVSKMKGLLKISKNLPLLIAIPTTAGTGSETTLAAVITDDKTHHKYPINDFCLIPKYAVLDYKNTIGLPPHITSTTGMDALTHAVEAYIGGSTTRKTRKEAELATTLIVSNLYTAYTNGKNESARANMLMASYHAGVAFTISYVGYVHAIAHSLGGKYGVPHGLANAIILPHVLEAYGTKIHKKLARLARISGIADESDSNAVGALKFIAWIKEINTSMNIPTFIEQLKRDDIAELASLADAEANPLYPVPVLMNKQALEKLYIKLLK